LAGRLICGGLGEALSADARCSVGGMQLCPAWFIGGAIGGLLAGGGPSWPALAARRKVAAVALAAAAEAGRPCAGVPAPERLPAQPMPARDGGRADEVAVPVPAAGPGHHRE